MKGGNGGERRLVHAALYFPGTCKTVCKLLLAVDESMAMAQAHADQSHAHTESRCHGDTELQTARYSARSRQSTRRAKNLSRICPGRTQTPGACSVPAGRRRCLSLNACAFTEGARGGQSQEATAKGPAPDARVGRRPCFQEQTGACSRGGKKLIECPKRSPTASICLRRPGASCEGPRKPNSGEKNGSRPVRLKSLPAAARSNMPCARAAQAPAAPCSTRPPRPWWSGKGTLNPNPEA